jgi:hypothetical protein
MGAAHASFRVATGLGYGHQSPDAGRLVMVAAVVVVAVAVAVVAVVAAVAVAFGAASPEPDRRRGASPSQLEEALVAGPESHALGVPTRRRIDLPEKVQTTTGQIDGKVGRGEGEERGSCV